MAGREVVQLYFSAPQGALGKPARQLAGWKKTRLLRPGEAQWVQIRFPVSQMASYDDLGKVAPSAWVLEAGEYRFFVGNDVRAPQADFTWTLDQTRVTAQLTQRMAPTLLERRLTADGSFEPLLEDDANVYAYRRVLDGKALTVMCNWTDRTVPCALSTDGGEELISNYPSHKPGFLRPYEARVLLGEA